MIELKDLYRKEFSEINIDKEKKEIIKGNIKLQYKKYKKQRNFLVIIFALIGLFLISTGVIYAGEIREMINSLFVLKKDSKDSNFNERFIIDSEAVKKINYDAKLEEPRCTKNIDRYIGIDKNDECYTLYSYNDVEKILGIKLLKSDEFINNNLILERVSKEENYLSYVRFYLPNVLSKDKNEDGMLVSLSIYFKTKYALDESYVFAGITSDTELHYYNVDNLNIQAIAYDRGKSGRFVFLQYDDVIYQFEVLMQGNDYNIDDKIEQMLNKLKY